LWHYAFYGTNLVVRHRRAGIAVNAALTTATTQVAAETTFYYVKADNGIKSNLKHGFLKDVAQKECLNLF
jgi:hypothetical protein